MTAGRHIVANGSLLRKQDHVPPPRQTRKVKTDRIPILPSELMIHKSTHGLDSRIFSFGKPAIPNPLAVSLGTSGFGMFEKNPIPENRRKFAFLKMEEFDE